jgi:hypothetical protein
MKAALKESDIVEKVTSIMDKYFPSSEETRLLKVMAELKGSDCLSVEECTSVFECHHEWGCRLLMKAALKESDIVEKVTSIMDKYFPSSEETSLLKVMADLKGSECLSVEECAAVFPVYQLKNVRQFLNVTMNN